MAAEVLPTTYILDTHSLHWYWTDPARLGPAASDAFAALEARRAVGLVPLIVVAELKFLSDKQRRQVSVEELLLVMDRAPSLRLEALTRRHLIAFGSLTDVPEMHDRFIGAVALVHNAPVVSRDLVFRDHPLIRRVW